MPKGPFVGSLQTLTNRTFVLSSWCAQPARGSDRRSGDPPASLGQRSSAAGDRACRRGRVRGRRGAARDRRSGGIAAAGAAPGTIRSRERGPHRPNRVRGAGRDPGHRWRAARRDGLAPRRSLQRQDDARAPARGRGAGGRLDRRLARCRTCLRPGRGGRARREPRLARRPDAGLARRGSRDGGFPAPGPGGRRPRHRPAGPAAGPTAGRNSTRPTARPTGPDRPDRRRSSPSAGRARASRRRAPRRPRAAGTSGKRGRGARRIGRAAARSGASGVAPPRPRRRRPADRGRRRPQPLRAAGAPRGPGDRVRRRRRPGRLPRETGAPPRQLLRHHRRAGAPAGSRSPRAPDPPLTTGPAR